MHEKTGLLPDTDVEFLHSRPRRPGARSAPLPGFFIGAHAAAAGLSLRTRDPRRYRRYFPRVKLITPR